MMQGIEKGDFSQLPLMHHLLAGMKANSSEQMMVGIDAARVNCGGAGY